MRGKITIEVNDNVLPKVTMEGVIHPQDIPPAKYAISIALGQYLRELSVLERKKKELADVALKEQEVVKSKVKEIDNV